MIRCIQTLTIVLSVLIFAQPAHIHAARAAATRAIATSTIAQAQSTLVPGTVTLPAGMEAALLDALARADGAIPLTNYYAPSALQQTGDWYFVSLVGLNQLDAGQSWRLENADWIGLALLTQQSGAWTGAVEGTSEYSKLLAQVPDSVVDAPAKAALDPIRRPAALAETYRFPWQTGTSMLYGSLGIHTGGFSSLGKYKAVDFLSDANTAAGHAPNQLLAAAAGSINYVCDDGTSIGIRIGNLMYVHLLANANLTVGHAFAQGDALGPLKTGSFSNNCGYASQGDSWFHVHWVFPDTLTGTVPGLFQAGGWTLTYTVSDTLSTVPWRRGTESRSPGSWLVAETTVATGAGWHAEYFSDKTLTTRCYETYEDTTYVFKLWDTGVPVTGCPSDSFSVRFTRTITFTGGSYRFHLDHDDGARLYLDGQLAIDAWLDGSSSNEVTRTLSGQHVLKIDYYDNTGSAGLGAWWYGAGALPTAPAADASTWRAEYYGNHSLWGQPALVLNESGTSISHAWGDAGPGYQLPADDFSARFTRSINFACGRYRFNVHADDGVRLWVGSLLALDQWQAQDASFQVDVDLSGGARDVVVAYYERGWGATLGVTWQWVSGESCMTVGPDLRPYTLSGRAAPVVPSPVQGTTVTGTLTAGKSTFFDWHIINDGFAGTSSGFNAALWIDGVQRVQTAYLDIERGLIASTYDWSTVVSTPGWHRVKLVVDPSNSVAEADETNNVWEGSFYWQPAALTGPPAGQYLTLMPLMTGQD